MHLHIRFWPRRPTCHDVNISLKSLPSRQCITGEPTDSKTTFATGPWQEMGADGKVSNGKAVNGKANGSNISLEASKGPWAECAACSAQGPRPQNEDVHVMLCSGLPEGPAPNIKAAGLPGLFDDLPELVSGPSLPEKPLDTPKTPECLFAVFDGHGGAAAARACAERFPTEIREARSEMGKVPERYVELEPEILNAQKEQVQYT